MAVKLYGATVDTDMVDRVVDNENTAVMRELIYALWAAVNEEERADD